MAGSFIDIAERGSEGCRGYLSLPPSGKGPGLVICQEIFGVNAAMRQIADRYAEEGYVTLVPDLFWRMEQGVDLDYTEEGFVKAFDFYNRFDVDQGIDDLGVALDCLKNRDKHTGKVAILGFCLGGRMAYLTAARKDPSAAIAYYGVGIDADLDEAKNITCPTVLHFALNDQFVPQEAITRIEEALKSHPSVQTFTYPGVDHAFAREGGDHYNRPASLMAQSRTLQVLRAEMGPHYDLAALWDLHTKYEFVDRDSRSTMDTMVDEPYVNHMPTMTGGVGKKLLHRFYEYHFIPKNPADTSLVPISRTIGVDRVVDEMIFSFTHDSEIDWMLPGVPPTGKHVEIPLVAVVCFRGDKLYHEHIYWDQASVLVQIGLLDPEGLPVAGGVTAKKAVDKSLPSNELMKELWTKSEGKPL